jgi:16S rRNA processing protein RimM
VTLYGRDPSSLIEAKRLWLVDPEGQRQSVLLSGFSGKPVLGGIIAKIEGYSTREKAESLKGLELAVNRNDFPLIEDEEEYYQADLLELEAFSTSGQSLGFVKKFLESGASLILVIIDDKGHERLVPFTEECVPKVDLQGRSLVVSQLLALLD